MQANEAIEKQAAALKKVREDINWMLNSRQLLNAHVFDYLDDALAATATIDPPAAPVLAAVGVEAQQHQSAIEDIRALIPQRMGAEHLREKLQSIVRRFPKHATAEQSSTAGAAKGGNTNPEVPAAQPAAGHAKRAEGADAFGFAVMEHLGPDALTGGKMTPYRAFELGWQARGQQAGAPEGWAADLRAIDKAMQHMGDALNEIDAVEADDEEAATPGFEAIARLLAAIPREAK